MEVFEIYYYSDPYKGWGYGGHVDYFVPGDELLEAYRDSSAVEEPTSGQVAGEAGYEQADHTARLLTEEQLREQRAELEDELEDLRDRLDRIDEVLDG